MGTLDLLIDGMTEMAGIMKRHEAWWADGIGTVSWKTGNGRPGLYHNRLCSRLVWMVVGWLLCLPIPAKAVVEHPTSLQLEQAVEQGERLAKERQPPVTLYAHFGSSDVLAPRGFLMTKLGGVAVLSSHFALRGERPSPADIQRVLDEDALQIVVTVLGDTPVFAKDSYLLLKQGDQVVTPVRIRSDGRAETTGQGPGPAAFRAKIVASFAYGSFLPDAETVIAVFPGTGGEINFLLDFSGIP
jgi:hypothetical protein